MAPFTLSLGSLIFSVTLATAAQEELAVREGITLEALREQCRRLVKAVQPLDVLLPPAKVKQLEELLARKSAKPEADVEAIQHLLDPHCLVRVHINPESRVKAARGPAEAVLVHDRDVFALVKVHNEAGVTHALTVAGPQLLARGKKESGRWLDAAVHAGPPMRKTLSGAQVEYVLLRLTARESGKREATLAFDVGQGTQDLGFRAEVPILFAVRAAKQ
jgi:hypothetical protein